MPGAYVKDLGGAGAASTTSTQSMKVTAATAAGNGIVVVVVCAGGAASFTTVTDSKGNTYDKLGEVRAGSNNVHAAFLARNAAALTTSDTITVTSSVSNQYPSMVAFEFSGVSGAQDAYTSGISAGATTTFDSGTAAVPAGDHLLIGTVGSARRAGGGAPPPRGQAPPV